MSDSDYSTYSASEEGIFDVIIVGAGISGVNAAQRIQTLCPWARYTVLESRDSMGGTWSFFKYPGLRSDSDLYTFGFPWHPWTENKTIADGESICNYIRSSAAAYGIDKKVRYNHKLITADWSSKAKSWDLLLDVKGERKHFRSRFILLSTGYYDYNAPLDSVVPGIKDFKGTVVHPQFWPEDLDYSGKKIVIIGSGATAVTMVPVLAEKAGHVTMLQRSPSYIMSLPTDDGLARWSHKWLPQWLAHKVVRTKFLVLPLLFFSFCSNFPQAARRLLKKAVSAQLPATIGHDPHFEPKYNPWTQRMCLCPDGDFFKSLNTGRVDIVTGTIDTVTATGIRVHTDKPRDPAKQKQLQDQKAQAGATDDPEEGKALLELPESEIVSAPSDVEADIIITATGLKMQLAGGARFTVDGGAPLALNEKFLWKGIMLQDLPNVANVVGYARQSWTLGAEATAQHVCRLLTHMRRHHLEVAVPRVRNPAAVKQQPILDLTSTYVLRGMKDMPKTGTSGPWRPRSMYFWDIWQAHWGDLKEGMEFER